MCSYPPSVDTSCEAKPEVFHLAYLHGMAIIWDYIVHL